MNSYQAFCDRPDHCSQVISLVCDSKDCSKVTVFAFSSFEFFYNLLFSAKSWQNPATIDGEEQNKKLPLVGIEPTTSRSSL